MKRVQIYYGGRVQGVGFRYRVQRLAAGYDVTGLVRNLADGRVELMAEGEETELQDFLRGIEESDLAGFIREKVENWSFPPHGLRGFQIVE